MSRRITYKICMLLYSLFITNLSFSQIQYAVEKLPINASEYDDFSPTYFKDGIVFCSNRKNNIFISYSDTSDESVKLNDLYFSRSGKDGKKWSAPQRIAKGINSLFQEGPSSFYNNNTSIVFTRNQFTEQTFGNYMKSGNLCGIYFAEYAKSEWTNITAFPYNSSEYNLMHPTITSDGKTLYFTSDNPGGYGGFDIYESDFDNGRWSAPKNLGPKVNSEKNEAFPFIHSSGKLYFASKGWKSRGGFDIFFTQKFEGNWIQPQTMKEPFNSAFDDFGLIADEDLQTGYFASNRAKSDDLYSFKSTISEFENCKPQQKNNFCYIFFENGTNESDVNGTMKYEWDMGDGTKVRALQAEHCFATVGSYKVQLNVIDSMTGEVLLNQATYDFAVEEIEQPFINVPEFANAGDTLKIDAKKTNLKNFKVAKYYWDFGDGLKGIGEKVNHAYYEEGVYDIKLQLESIAGRNGVKKACIYRSVAIKSK